MGNLMEVGVGTLILMDWLEDVNGRDVKGFYGKVSIGNDQNVVGFEAKGHNSANWIARVEGETEAVTIMGCQVRAFYESANPPSIATQYQVLA